MMIHDGAAAHEIGALIAALGSATAYRYISLAVRTMPVPQETDSRWYKWLYNFFQDAFANPDKKVN